MLNIMVYSCSYGIVCSRVDYSTVYYGVVYHSMVYYIVEYSM